MLTAPLPDSTREHGTHGATQHRTRWWETAYTTVHWDYPPSPAAYRDALLSRGASHSRFLRIAYLSTRERNSTTPSSPPFSLSTHSQAPGTSTPSTVPSTCPATSSRTPAVAVPPIPSYPPLRPYATVRPRSTHPTPHALKRRHPQWPKPPHYHAALLRSPLPRRRGLFRAVLPPNQAVDFFRWDVLSVRTSSLSAPYAERDSTRTRMGGDEACAPGRVAESALESYEAGAGFFGWHGLGLNECCAREGVAMGRPRLEHGDEGNGARRGKLPLEVDEGVVEQGRARWACTAEELVGPPGIALRWVVEQGQLGQVAPDPTLKDVVDAHALSNSSRHEEVRWDSDIGSSSSRLPSDFDEKRLSPPWGKVATVSGSSSNSNKPAHERDSSSIWWYPPPHREPPTTPHVPRLPPPPPPPPVQYAHPPVQFSPWFPGGRVASAQGHGYWYDAQPVGAPLSMNRDPKSLVPPSHMFSVTPTSMYPPHSPRYPSKTSLSRDEYGDKDAETDHDYESTTTTTDSDPPPHTPIGAATTSHCTDTLQVHGDDEVEVHGVQMDSAHAAASVTVGLLASTGPVKPPDRFSTAMSPSVSPGSPGCNRACCESFKAAVVFPSLNGSFRQRSSSRISVSLSRRAMSVQTTPVKTVAPVSLSSLSFAKESTQFDEDDFIVKPRSVHLGPPAPTVSGNSTAYTPNPGSLPPTSPNSTLRKDSQGFCDPAMTISPSSSSSSLPLLSPEGNVVSRSTKGWPCETMESVPEPLETTSSRFTTSGNPKARSVSPSPRRVAGACSTPLSSARPTSLTSPTPTPTSGSVFGGSYPSSPSPTNSASLVPPNSNSTSLLPTFLATATVKRKKASRTREIVDRLRSSSIDAGKEGAGLGSLDSLGWLAGSSAGGEVESAFGKSPGSDRAAGNQCAGGTPPSSSSSSSSSSPPSKSSVSESASWLGSDLGKDRGQDPGSKNSDAGPCRSRGKNNGATQALLANPRAITTTTSTSPSAAPFPILNVSQQTPVSGSTVTHQSQTSGPTGTTTMSSSGGDGSKMNTTAASLNKRPSGLPLPPSAPNGPTSPPTHPSHHPLPSPSRPTVHPLPPLGLPPLPAAVSPYPPPMYVPFAQYHVAPPQQGTWLAVYPGPAHLPVHPLPAQIHVTSVTGASGMRHVSW